MNGSDTTQGGFPLGRTNRPPPSAPAPAPPPSLIHFPEGQIEIFRAKLREMRLGQTQNARHGL